MKKVDTLIVGLGIAGLAYAEQLRKKERSFCVIDEGQKGSTLQAAGIFNPTVLKRYTLSWQGLDFHKTALPFYEQLDADLRLKSLQYFPILKLFPESTDYNHWVTAADTHGLDQFLDPHLYKDQPAGVLAPFGFGKVKLCGRLNTPLLLSTYAKRLQKEERLLLEKVDHSLFEVNDQVVRYKNIEAQRVVFCEGYKMKENPFFGDLPLVGSKGEILIIKAQQLKLNAILKVPIFIVPLGNDRYWAGATFNRTDKSTVPSEEGRIWLETKLAKMIGVPYTVEQHVAQIRPTVQDRRPLLGQHPQYRSLFVLNGFGSRGVLTAPTASKWLFDYIEEGQPLPEEVNFRRFLK